MTATETRHTPGPWENHKWNSSEHQISALGGTLALVSHDHSLIPDEQADANARLIAAAPDLLAMLQNLAPMLDNAACAVGGDDGDPFAEDLADAAMNVRELIRKATAR